MDFYRAKQYIINRLHTDLDPKIIYHNLEHTLHVYHAAQDYCLKENIDEHSTLLVLTAALYHDSGMLIDYIQHEEASVAICEQELPKFDYNAEEIKIIARLIRKTKLFEKADCILENILCDSDLDYLGREDFFIRSTKLLLEWKNMNKHDYSLYEWLEVQVEFLENHEFHTDTAKKLRDSGKSNNAKQIHDLYKICPDHPH